MHARHPELVGQPRNAIRRHSVRSFQGEIAARFVSLEEQQQLRCNIWREREFGSPGRGKPGTVVKTKGDGAIKPAYLAQVGAPSHVILDTGPGIRADFEVVTPRAPLPDFVPSRLWLPYGIWTLQDNSRVLFSRDNFPLWRIYDNGIQRLEPWLWIKEKKYTYHFCSESDGFSWSHGVARSLALAFLVERRIFDIPQLVDVMPTLVKTAASNIDDGLAVILRSRGGMDRPPPFACLNSRFA